MSCIYKITNLVNGKIYIGKTEKTIQERFEQHKIKASQHPNRYLYDAMNHYGYSNFKIEEVELVEDIDELDNREIYWIKFYNSINPEIGYNMTIGGDGGNTWQFNNDKQKTGELIRQQHLKERYIPLTKESLMQDIQDGLLAKEMQEKYHCSGETLANRFKIYFGKSLNEIRPLKNSGQFKKKEIDKNILLKDIKTGMSLKELAIKHNVSEKTIRNRCKEFYNKTIIEIRKESV